MKRFLAKNWFLVGLLVALGFALTWPAAGRAAGLGGWTSKIAIGAIFVASGLGLPTEQVVQGLRRYPVHLYVHAFLFLVAPALCLATSRLFAGVWGADIQAGLLALACLPTTISSCVVLTQLAGGSVPVSLFNAVVSNAAGIVLSPLLLTALLGWSGASLPASAVARVMGALALTVVLPFGVGQALHRIDPRWCAERRRELTLVSGGLMLAVVWLVFSSAAGDPALRAALGHMPALAAFVVGFHLLLLASAWAGARLLGFEHGEVVAVALTAPQKTIAFGVPMITAYFAGDAARASLALLPLLLYHPLQVFTAGVAMHLAFMRRKA